MKWCWDIEVALFMECCFSSGFGHCLVEGSGKAHIYFQCQSIDPSGITLKFASLEEAKTEMEKLFDLKEEDKVDWPPMG